MASAGPGTGLCLMPVAVSVSEHACVAGGTPQRPSQLCLPFLAVNMLAPLPFAHRNTLQQRRSYRENGGP